MIRAHSAEGAFDMNGMNRCDLIGHAGKDAVLTESSTGTSVCKFALATNESWYDRDEQKQKSITDWHNIIIWGKLAEKLAPMITKGAYVYICGRLKTRSWENKEGNRVTIPEVHAKRVLLLQSKAQATGASDFGDVPETPPEDEIPF